MSSELEESAQRAIDRNRKIAIAIGIFAVALVVCAVATLIALALLGPAIGNIFSNIIVPE